VFSAGSLSAWLLDFWRAVKDGRETYTSNVSFVRKNRTILSQMVNHLITYSTAGLPTRLVLFFQAAPVEVGGEDSSGTPAGTPSSKGLLAAPLVDGPQLPPVASPMADNSHHLRSIMQRIVEVTPRGADAQPLDVSFLMSPSAELLPGRAKGTPSAFLGPTPRGDVLWDGLDPLTMTPRPTETPQGLGDRPLPGLASHLRSYLSESLKKPPA
jgi:hypothetical protein